MPSTSLEDLSVKQLHCDIEPVFFTILTTALLLPVNCDQVALSPVAVSPTASLLQAIGCFHLLRSCGVDMLNKSAGDGALLLPAHYCCLPQYVDAEQAS